MFFHQGAPSTYHYCHTNHRPLFPESFEELCEADGMIFSLPENASIPINKEQDPFQTNSVASKHGLSL